MKLADRVGDFVQAWGGENPVEILYGVIVKIGTKRAEVVWESDHHTRPIVGHVDLRRADFRDFSPDERAKVVLRLREAQRSGYGPSREPVFDGLCEKALHGLDYKGQPCDLCAKHAKVTAKAITDEQIRGLLRDALDSGDRDLARLALIAIGQWFSIDERRARDAQGGLLWNVPKETAHARARCAEILNARAKETP